VAWDYEVVRKPIARTVGDTPLALYRTEDGDPVALADACWHRLAPLSMGTVEGKDGLRCPYHGIVYNSAGRCVSMPAQETINPSAGVEMLSDCGKGECGLCEVRVTALTGKIDHRDVFYSERQKDAASKLSCCVSRVISDQPGKTPTIDIITA